METKNCKYCGEPFDGGHGNSGYCDDECAMEAKKERQKIIRDGIKSLLPILIHNHKILAALYKTEQRIFTEQQLELEGIDFSLFRHLFPEPDNPKLIRCDFGTYYLETNDNFLTFKLSQHEAETI